MSNKRTYYVVQIGKFYVHRYSELDTSPPIVHLTCDLHEANRFDAQTAAVAFAARVFDHVHDNTEINVHRIFFETVHKLRRKRPRKSA